MLTLTAVMQYVQYSFAMCYIGNIPMKSESVFVLELPNKNWFMNWFGLIAERLKGTFIRVTHCSVSAWNGKFVTSVEKHEEASKRVKNSL